MNRLCLGALGLLLALSATCLAEDIVLEDFKDQSNYQTAKASSYKLTGDERTNLVKLLRSKPSEKYQFVVEATRVLYGHMNKALNKDQAANNKKAEDRIIKVLEGMNKDSIANDAEYSSLSAQERLTKLEGYSGVQYNSSKLRYEAARLYHYFATLKDRTLRAYKTDKVDLVEKYIGRYEELVDENKDKKDYVLPDPISEEEARKYTVDWSKEKWDDAYTALPEIKKYFASGLNPQSKKRLSKDFKVLDSHQDYNMKKKHSQIHIDHIAVQARLEAIKHSHTAAGKYFATHENWIAQQLEKIDNEMKTDMKRKKVDS